MHPDIKAALQETYPRFNNPHDRASRAQRLAIQQILTAATRTELHVRNTQAIVLGHISAQNFHAEGTHPSQAESTLQNYDPGRTSSPSKHCRGIIICFGCRLNHLWQDCPKRNDPATQEIAKKSLESGAAKMLELEGAVAAVMGVEAILVVGA